MVTNLNPTRTRIIMCSTARCEICVATKHNDMFNLSLIDSFSVCLDRGDFFLVHRDGRTGRAAPRFAFTYS